MKITSKQWRFTLWSAAVTAAMAHGFDKQDLAERIPGEFVAKPKDAQTLNQLMSVGGLKIKNVLRSSDSVVLLKRDTKSSLKSLGLDSRVSENGLDRAIRKALLSSGNYQYVEPNYIYRLSEHSRNGLVQALSPISKTSNSEQPPQDSGLVPNDAMFQQLWGLQNLGQADSSNTAGVLGADIDATLAWKMGTGSKDIVVAVIDTGIDYNHPDLVENIWSAPHPDPEVGGVIHGFNAIDDSFDPMDDNEHGTHCAGTIGGVGNNGVGVAGVSWNVSLMGVKFLSASGSGSLANAIKAIDFATENNADIMSNSWGGGGYSEALKESIERASDKGIVFVAAAGNSSSDNDALPSYPATYDVPNVISVAATTNQDTLASFSSYGKKTVHVGAPGHNIVSTTPENTYSSFSGTSMATPHVSGAVALFKSLRGSQMTHVEIRDEILKTSERVASIKKKVAFGGSRLNLNNLLAGTVVPGPVVVPDDQWSPLVENVIETEHPYPSNAKLEWRLTSESGKYMRIHFAQFETENRYDNVYIINAKTGEVLETISGNKGAFVTEQIDATDLIIQFQSDNSVTKFGFVIEGYSWSDYAPAPQTL